MTFVLQCVTCRREFDPDQIAYTCPDCGPLFGTLNVVYDLESVRSKLTVDHLANDRNPTHWRYLPILPIKKPELIQPLAVGGTPLYHCPRLATEMGLKKIWVKDDGRNPTASYKDRASSVAVVKALEKKVTTITAASTGNAASSLAAVTALAGLRTVIFVPENAPRPKIAQLLIYGAEVIRVKGTYDEAFDLCCRAAAQWGWYNRSTAINPYLGEGKKTGALEICEQLQWNVPDYVLVSVGDGCIFQGLWKGFTDFYRLGLIDRLPRMIGVQAEGSAPLVKAFEAGEKKAAALIPNTLADSIAVGVPRDQIKALQTVYDSSGRFVSVSDEQILAAMRLLSQRVGVMAEPAGAAAMAGLVHLAEHGHLKSSDTAVVFVTGHGLKDIDGVLKAVNQSPILVENSLDAVAHILREK